MPKDNTIVMKTKEQLADKAFEKEMETNTNFWNIGLDDDEVKYWKEVWIKGYDTAMMYAKEKTIPMI